MDIEGDISSIKTAVEDATADGTPVVVAEAIETEHGAPRHLAAGAQRLVVLVDRPCDLCREQVAGQVHGARGYSTDYPVERYMREAKGTQIYDGTNEINRLVVANRMYE